MIYGFFEYREWVLKHFFSEESHEDFEYLAKVMAQYAIKISEKNKIAKEVFAN
jgi:hypothetical protein